MKPFIEIEPDVGCNNPIIVLINVVFPAPFWPNIPIISPSFILREIFFKAWKISKFRLKNDFNAPLKPAFLLKSLN